uniref:Uncharacterized protein n=1 Tax=Cacopsylla melanoneura TaxID=428564 RepID=A0A8D8SN78_9HEMI
MVHRKEHHFPTKHYGFKTQLFRTHELFFLFLLRSFVLVRNRTCDFGLKNKCLLRKLSIATSVFKAVPIFFFRCLGRGVCIGTLGRGMMSSMLSTTVCVGHTMFASKRLGWSWYTIRPCPAAH